MTNPESSKPNQLATICSFATWPIGIAILALVCIGVGRSGTPGVWDGSEVWAILAVFAGLPVLALVSIAFSLRACCRREPKALGALAFALAIPVLLYLATPWVGILAAALGALFVALIPLFVPGREDLPGATLKLDSRR